MLGIMVGTIAGWRTDTSVWLIRTSAFWGPVFWIAVVVRLAIEVGNSARQPAGGAREADSGSRRVLGRTILMANVAGYWVAFRFPRLAVPGPGAAYLAVGLSLMVCGIVLRQWAVRTLGHFFTFTVMVHDEHRVVDTGPYRAVRHPSYTGAVLAELGVAIALGNALAFFVLTIPHYAALVHRIRVEEAALRDGLGERYSDYAASRKRLIPGIW